MSTASLLSGLLLVTFLVLVRGQHLICPPPERIVPCTCDQTWLTCSSPSPAQLTRVFDAVRDQAKLNVINGFTLRNYSHPSLPSGLFTGLVLRSMALQVSGLTSFRVPSTNESFFRGAENSLQSLSLEYFDRPCDDFDWSSLSPLTSVRNIFLRGSFSAVRSPLPAMPSVVIFYVERTDIDFVVDGAFAGFINLEELRLTDNMKLRTLSRSFYASPADKVRHVIITNELMTTLPEDLFQGMASLQYVHLPSFVHNIPPLMHNGTANLQGSRGLTCDARLKWLLRMRDEGSVNILHAICARPKHLYWRDVQSLTYAEL